MWCGLNKPPELNLKENKRNDTHTHTHTPHTHYLNKQTHTHNPNTKKDFKRFLSKLYMQMKILKLVKKWCWIWGERVKQRMNPDLTASMCIPSVNVFASQRYWQVHDCTSHASFARASVRVRACEVCVHVCIDIKSHACMHSVSECLFVQQPHLTHKFTKWSSQSDLVGGADGKVNKISLELWLCAMRGWMQEMVGCDEWVTSTWLPTFNIFLRFRVSSLRGQRVSKRIWESVRCYERDRAWGRRVLKLYRVKPLTH